MNETKLREEFYKEFEVFDHEDSVFEEEMRKVFPCESGYCGEDPKEIADWWLSKFSTYQQELLEKVRGMIGITTTKRDESVVMIKMGDTGGFTDYIDSNEYIRKIDVIKALSEVEKIIQNHA